jgi:hypothetical protein
MENFVPLERYSALDNWQRSSPQWRPFRPPQPRANAAEKPDNRKESN